MATAAAAAVEIQRVFRGHRTRRDLVRVRAAFLELAARLDAPLAEAAHDASFWATPLSFRPVGTQAPLLRTRDRVPGLAAPPVVTAVSVAVGSDEAPEPREWREARHPTLGLTAETVVIDIAPEEPVRDVPEAPEVAEAEPEVLAAEPEGSEEGEARDEVEPDEVELDEVEPEVEEPKVEERKVEEPQMSARERRDKLEALQEELAWVERALQNRRAHLRSLRRP